MASTVVLPIVSSAVVDVGSTLLNRLKSFLVSGSTDTSVPANLAIATAGVESTTPQPIYQVTGDFTFASQVPPT